MSSSVAPTARAFLRAANGLGSRSAEAVWAASIALLAKAPRHSVARWTSSGHERVLVIAPHPDDEVAGCAGTLIRHAQVGDAVRVAVMTDGSKSRASRLDAPTMAQLRESESRAAAERMGARCCWMGLREGEWSDDEGRAALRRELREADPTVVYAPSNIDFHPEHLRVAKAFADCLSELGRTPNVRMYPVQVPLTPLLTNLVHDVSDLEAEIRAVFNCYASQQNSLRCTLRSRRYAARYYGASRQAEGFCALSAELYRLLHRRFPAHFRSFGIRAWADPLAVLVGAQERMFWRRIAIGPVA